MTEHCLLTESLLPLAETGGSVRRTLPGVLAALAADTVDDIEDLAAHQQQSWYQFLVQLAAIALAADDPTGEPDPRRPLPTDEEVWRRMLSVLAPAEVWSLANPRLDEPAFLQPPVPEGDLERFDILATEPDALDVCVTSKALDLKPARAGRPEPHHWAYALVSLQTTMGFLGRGNYGISRMNGGFSSRPMMELVPLPLRWGTRFARAVRLLLRERERLLTTDGLAELHVRRGGDALLWLRPWDGTKAFPLAGMEPHFIEICRRVRLVEQGGRLIALGRPTDAPRLDAKHRKGDLGDPWVPVQDGAALTLQKGAFGYRRLSRLLTDGGVSLPAAVMPAEGDGQRVLLHAAVLVRGQGTTDGLESRWIQTSVKVARQLGRRPGTETRLQGLCKDMLGDAAKAARAMKIALLTAVQYRGAGAAGEKLDFDDAAANPAWEALEARIDAIFFDHLFARVEAESHEEERTEQDAWFRNLRRQAEDVFRSALGAVPVAAARRETARAAAELRFRGMLAKDLPLPGNRDRAEETTHDPVDV